jgi:hypothetical protein
VPFIFASIIFLSCVISYHFISVPYHPIPIHAIHSPSSYPLFSIIFPHAVLSFLFHQPTKSKQENQTDCQANFTATLWELVYTVAWVEPDGTAVA